MRQEPGLAEHSLRRPADIVERRLTTECLELVTGSPVAQLGLVAESEQRLAAAGGRAGAGDPEHLVDRHVGTLTAPRRVRECAVVADVAAELRQRDEDLRRIRDETTVTLIAQRPRVCTELVERPGEELHQQSLDRRMAPTETQMKSTDATPSAVATSTAATPDAASDQRLAAVPGAARTAAPARPSVTPANVSTA